MARPGSHGGGTIGGPARQQRDPAAGLHPPPAGHNWSWRGRPSALAGRDHDAPAPAELSDDGYTLLHWTQGGMTFWAVSDVTLEDLQSFVAQFQK